MIWKGGDREDSGAGECNTVQYSRHLQEGFKEMGPTPSMGF